MPLPIRKSNHFIRNLVPFLGLVVGSFVGLAQFRKLNYQYKRNDGSVTREQMEQVGVQKDEYQSKVAPSLQDEFDEMKEKIKLDDWKNIRGPRPWENSKETQEKLRNEDNEPKK